MIAVDTNVLVRLVTNDEPGQARRAAELLRRKPVFVPKTVLLEMEWVLRHAYRLERPAILRAFYGVLGLPTVTVEDGRAVARALAWYEEGMDFADALHVASSGEAQEFTTFDAQLARKAGKLVELAVTRL